MKRIFILLASLLIAGNVYALPQCPASGYFDNCFGTWTDAYGNKYVGEFKDNKSHGQGPLAYADERKYVGEFKESLPWKGLEYDKDGNITFKVKEGVKSELP